jgi:hypothetical protein
VERLPVTRKTLGREIVLDAAKRPLNIGVTAVVVAGAFVYAAIVVATALDGERAERVGERTYAKARVLRGPVEPRSTVGLAPEIAGRVSVAHDEEKRIHAALSGSPAAVTAEIGAEVDRLMAGLEDLARHANVAHVYLRDDNVVGVRARLKRLRTTQTGDPVADRANEQAAAALEDQLAARGQIERQLARFDAQIDHIAATLGTIHAQLIRMSSEEQAGEQRRLADQVRALRREIGATADAMQEAYDDAEAR